MDNLMYLINEQNKLLERIAKALERAYPPSLKELKEPSCAEEAIAMGYRLYDPITMKWSDE